MQFAVSRRLLFFSFTRDGLKSHLLVFAMAASIFYIKRAERDVNCTWGDGPLNSILLLVVLT